MADPVPPPVPFDIRVKDGEDTSATTPKRSVSIAQSHQTSDTEPVTVLNEKDIEKGGFIQPQTGHDSDADPNIVDFNGPDDPSLAVNWQSSRKWSMVTALSLYTLLTPLASSMFAPGIPELLRDFQSTSMTLGAFVISVYVLGYAAGPMIIAPLSELYGRQPIYHVCNVCFVILTVACALATNINMLIGFRLLAGLAGSATLTLGGGTIADLFVTEERGKAMALWSMGPLLGPVIGPGKSNYYSVLIERD